MVFIQSDSDCKIYKNADVIIAVSENPHLTPEIVKLRLIDRCLLELSQGELTKKDAISLLEELKGALVFLIDSNNVDTISLANIIKDIEK